MIAENRVKGNAREALLKLAANGRCRPVHKISRSYSDCTNAILSALHEMNIGVALTKYGRGYYFTNDAPRGGKLGTILNINFEV